MSDCGKFVLHWIKLFLIQKSKLKITFFKTEDQNSGEVGFSCGLPVTYTKYP